MAESRTKTPAKMAVRGAGPGARRARGGGRVRRRPARDRPRAAAALGASVALIDARGAVLAVAAGAPSEESALLSSQDGVTAIDLRVSESIVGQLRFRAASELPEPALLRMVTTLLALEVERTRAPERAGEAAVGSFLRRCWSARSVTARPDRARQGARRRPRGGRQRAGRAPHPRAPAEGDWQARALTMAARAARAGSCPGRSRPCARPHRGDRAGRRRGPPAAPPRRVLRSLDDSLPGFASWSAAAASPSDPMDLHRAAAEALLAANVASPTAGRERLCRSTTPAPTGCCCPR